MGLVFRKSVVANQAYFEERIRPFTRHVHSAYRAMVLVKVVMLSTSQRRLAIRNTRTTIGIRRQLLHGIPVVVRISQSRVHFGAGVHGGVSGRDGPPRKVLALGGNLELVQRIGSRLNTICGRIELRLGGVLEAAHELRGLRNLLGERGGSGVHLGLIQH